MLNELPCDLNVYICCVKNKEIFCNANKQISLEGLKYLQKQCNFTKKK